MTDNVLIAGLPLKTLFIIGGLFTISALCPSIAALVLIRREKGYPYE